MNCDWKRLNTSRKRALAAWFKEGKSIDDLVAAQCFLTRERIEQAIREALLEQEKGRP